MSQVEIEAGDKRGSPASSIFTGPVLHLYFELCTWYFAAVRIAAND